MILLELLPIPIATALTLRLVLTGRLDFARWALWERD